MIKYCAGDVCGVARLVGYTRDLIFAFSFPKFSPYAMYGYNPFVLFRT